MVSTFDRGGRLVNVGKQGSNDSIMKENRRMQNNIDEIDQTKDLKN